MAMTAHDQGDLFGPPLQAAAGAPEGFRYQAEALSPASEAVLVQTLANLPFKPFEFHGYLGARRTVAFGFRYDYAKRAVESSAPLPEALLALRETIAAFAGRPAADFEQALATEYAPGAGIGWHRDKPAFGLVVGVSLTAPCVMRFRRKSGSRWERASAPLAPRSVYLLSGPARSQWEHSIRPMDQLRYSITFRTVAGEPRPAWAGPRAA